MDLAAQLAKRKSQLNRTETVVTSIDGARRVETAASDGERVLMPTQLASGTGLHPLGGFVVDSLDMAAEVVPDDGGIRAHVQRPGHELPTVAVLVREKAADEEHFLSFARSAGGVAALSQVDFADVQTGMLDGFDALIVPGGSIFEYDTRLGDSGAEAVCRFVHKGGGYLGSCCGAFLASRRGYDGARTAFSMLGVEPHEFIPGEGEAVCALTEFGRHTCLGSSASVEEARLFYCNGQTFGQPASGLRNEFLDVELPLAVPLLELLDVTTGQGGSWKAKHAAPSSGSVARAFAAVAGDFGAGRVVAFGPHPESVLSGAVGSQLVANSLKWVLRKT